MRIVTFFIATCFQEMLVSLPWKKER